MRDDAELLQTYAENRSEDAFAELVQRNLDLVYFAALRRCNGDTHAAEDVTQHVFTLLARQAAALTRHVALTGWLYTTTRNVAAKLHRLERNRRNREEAHAGVEMLVHDASAASVDWDRLRPVLDEVLDRLPELDRDAVLLRYFENRPFREIGRVLKLSEDAARMRVDRALEKLRAALSRQGVTSTSGALAVALANQAAFAKPAGLAASVVASALSQATALSGAAAAGLAITGFMSMAKFSGGVLTAAIGLVLSLSANAYLLWPPASLPTATALEPVASRERAAPPDVSVSSWQRADYVAVRDQLRAAGASDGAARGVIEGLLRRRYREKLSENRAEQMQHAWWRDTSWWWQPIRGDGPPRFVDDRKLLHEMVLDPLVQMFGPDPVETAEIEARYEFLPAEKRQVFVALTREHEAATGRLSGPEQNSSAGSTLKREHDEKQRRLLATLTAAERSEFDLRFSTTAVALRERMNQIGAQEEEYRSIMAAISTPGSETVRPASRDPERERLAYEQLVAKLGYERALDYIWAGAFEYPSYARVAQDAGLPAAMPGRILQLAAETINRAIDIHDQASLSAAEKRAAMVALQQQVRPQLDALLPPAQQQRLGPETLTWFTALSEGRYKFIPTSAGGTTGGIISPGTISVETPPPAKRTQRQFVVRRSNNG